MNEIRVIFSPHTADPAFIGDVAAALVTAQLTVAQAMWEAQLQILQTMLTAHVTFMDNVCRATLRAR